MSDELQEWYRMPSIKECLVEYEKQELGLIKDIAVHGCSGGVSGLTYYAETTAFHELHQEEIWQLVGDHADDNGLKNGEFSLYIILLILVPSFTLAVTGVVLLSLVGVL